MARDFCWFALFFASGALNIILLVLLISLWRDLFAFSPCGHAICSFPPLFDYGTPLSIFHIGYNLICNLNGIRFIIKCMLVWVLIILFVFLALSFSPVYPGVCLLLNHYCGLIKMFIVFIYFFVVFLSCTFSLKLQRIIIAKKKKLLILQSCSIFINRD